jgi:ABC-type transport auxiliary lipoprotein component
MNLNKLPLERYSPLVLFLYAAVGWLVGCSAAASFEGMIPTSFETVNNHPQTVRVSVTGGQESVPVGRPQITNAAFTQALIASIGKSRTFAKVIEDQNPTEDYRLTVTLFTLDKRVFGQAVTLEAGWTLRRATTGAIVWRESIVSQSAEGNFQQATEAAARNNIAEGLAKISKLNL